MEGRLESYRSLGSREVTKVHSVSWFTNPQNPPSFAFTLLPICFGFCFGISKFRRYSYLKKIYYQINPFFSSLCPYTSIVHTFLMADTRQKVFIFGEWEKYK